MALAGVVTEGLLAAGMAAPWKQECFATLNLVFAGLMFFVVAPRFGPLSELFRRPNPYLANRPWLGATLLVVLLGLFAASYYRIATR